MDLDRKKKIASKVYEPYHREASYCLGISVIVITFLILLGVVLSSYVDNNQVFLLFLPMILLYFFAEIFLNFRISILAFFEKRECNWENQELTILKISEDISFSGKFHSVIRKLYPKEMEFDRYRIVCEDKNGKKVVLKSAMSNKKRWKIVQRIFEQKSLTCNIYYGKHTQVVMYYKSTEHWTDVLNHML